MNSLINAKKNEIISRFETRLEALFRRCDTPIEKLFLSYFYHYFDTLHFSKIDFLFKEVVPINEGKGNAYLDEDFDFQELGSFLKITGIQILDRDIGGETRIHVYPQYQVQTQLRKTFRLDFGITIEKGSKKRLVGVECDGHEWHSTKDRITQDNQRVRQLNGLGWQVFRYSGSELYADTFKCIVDFEKNAIIGLDKL